MRGYVKHPITEKTVLLVQYMRGYIDLAGEMSEADPEQLNMELGVSKETVQALMIGSMWGWDAPGAQMPKEAAK